MEIKIRIDAWNKLRPHIEVMQTHFARLYLAAPGFTACFEDEDVVLTPYGDVPAMGDYWLAGVIDYGGSPPVVRRFPGSPPLNTWENRPRGACANCGKNHTSPQEFLLRRKNGAIVSVGRSCLERFTGHPNPYAMIQAAEIWRNVFVYALELSRPDSKRVPVVDYLGYVLRSIAEWGWVSTTAVTQGLPTISTAMDAANRLALARTNPAYCLSEQEKEVAASALAWAQSFFDRETGDFAHRMRSVLGNPYIASVDMGFVAYAGQVSLQRNWQIRFPRSQFLGELNARLQGMATRVIQIHRAIGNYGYRWLVFFQAGDDLVIWSASRTPALVVGQQLKLTGTVREHKEWYGVNCTWLTRCKWEE